MKIAVCVKAVPEQARRIDPATMRLDRSGEPTLNPFDANAVEEALRLKGDDADAEVVLVSLGPERSLDALRKALAMGADRVVLVSDEAAAGPVTYCTGKDTSGGQKASVAEFNKLNASTGLKARLLEFPESADEQRNQFIQRQEAKSGECDIFYSDVIWTAEFASQKWLLDMSDYINQRKAEFIPSTLSTIQFDGKYFGVPQQTDAAFVYYRTDKVKQLPQTWQALYD